MAGNQGPRKPQRCGLAGSSFLDDHAFRMRLPGTFVATAAYDFIRRRHNARPSIANTSQPQHRQTECQQNRVNIRPYRNAFTPSC